MRLLSAGLSDTGRLRTNNEDSFFAEGGPFFAVCDGVGGQRAGEVASRIAVNTIGDYLKRPKESFIGELDKRYSDRANRIASAIRLANKAIYDSASSNPAWQGMVTTVVAAGIEGGTLSIAHVGDSRIYLVRAGAIVQLTEDHTIVAEQVRGGLIGAEEAKSSKVRHMVTRALGLAPEVEVDVEDVPLMDGDRVILCTDGLTEMVSEDDILRTVSSDEGPERACKALVDAANENGGKDNITVVLVYLYRDNLYYYLKRLLGLTRR